MIIIDNKDLVLFNFYKALFDGISNKEGLLSQEPSYRIRPYLLKQRRCVRMYKDTQTGTIYVDFPKFDDIKNPHYEWWKKTK